MAAIYGANASGKSNVYEAFEYMTYYVLESFKFGDEDEKRRKEGDGYLKAIPFLLDESSRNEATTFEVFFVDNLEDAGKIYQYGFSLKDDEVVEEWLYSKAETARSRYKTIFYRKKGEELEMNDFARSYVELNARLHPLLVRNIILTFLSAEINTRNAQLIFTTHDVWQFTNELLRRDEIWMVNKDRDGASELYSLVDFKDEDGNKVRRDEPLAKRYLTGNYGAIPALKQMNMLREEGMSDGE